MKYLEYAKHIGADEFVEKWVKTTLKNYLSKENPSTEEVEHILDYLVQSGKKVSKMSYPEAQSNADKWMKTQIKKGNAIDEKPGDTEVVLDFKDGFKIVKLVGENAYKREGFLMRHCVASYFGKDVEIYSLRDKDNVPHATMERDQQIKGRGNGDIHPKYVDYVVKFLEHVGMTVGDSEMKHLGYLNFEKVKKYLHKDMKFYNKVYLQKDEKLIGKDGEEFASLDLLDIKDLISYENDELKIEFNLKSFIGLSINFLLEKSKKIIKNDSSQLAASGDSSRIAASGNYSRIAASGNSSQLAASGKYSRLAASGDSSRIAASGDYSQLAASGDYSRLAASGDSSRIAASGNYSRIAASGNSSQLAASGKYSRLAASGDSSRIAASGDYSRLAASGDYSRLAASGDSSQLAASGDYSRLAASGNYSQLAASGDSSQLAASGDSSRIAASGDYSRIAASGNSSQLEMNGNDSVGANIGINGKSKGKIGCWITLAEYEKIDNTYKPICVRSIKIDGKLIKEDIWYKLSEGEFVETE